MPSNDPKSIVVVRVVDLETGGNGRNMSVRSAGKMSCRVRAAVGKSMPSEAR
jgi:hypothetical protein